MTNFKNVNGGYAVSYTTKCISNLEDFAQEMMTHDHGEADRLQLMYQQETLSQSFTYTPLILMYFSYYSQVSNTLCKYSIQDW